jgi:hypothetical protein
MAVCQPQIMPGFIDLFWDNAIDVLKIAGDPGIQLDKYPRRVVLLKINNEIRYYAGSANPFVKELPVEIGVLPTESDALSFAHEYLVGCTALAEITIPRFVHQAERA